MNKKRRKFHNYWVREDGTVFRYTPSKPMELHPHKYPYYRLLFRYESYPEYGMRVPLSAAFIVATAFVDRLGLFENRLIEYIDGNSQNFHVDNLRLVPIDDNARFNHYQLHGSHIRPPETKLTYDFNLIPDFCIETQLLLQSITTIPNLYQIFDPELNERYFKNDPTLRGMHELKSPKPPVPLHYKRA